MTAYAPSGFYKRSVNLCGPLRAIQFGQQRSGTTLAYQFLNALAGDGIAKTHQWLTPRVPVLATVRDPRDSIVSHWQNNFQGATEFEPEQVLEYAMQYVGFAAMLDVYLDTHMVSVIRYEDWIGNPRILLMRCGELLGIDASGRDDLLERHSFAANKRLADSLTGVHPTLLLMPQHLVDGEVGKWRRVIPRDVWSSLTRMLGRWLERWNYDAE